MKKTYLAPETECICVKTFIVAASTAKSIKIHPTDSEGRTGSGAWGNIWDN
jgi:hypothetical protein